MKKATLNNSSEESEFQRVKNENTKLKEIIQRLAISIVNSNQSQDELILNAGGHQTHLKVGQTLTSQNLYVIQILSRFFDSFSNNNQMNQDFIIPSTTDLHFSDSVQISETLQDNLSKLSSLIERNRQADEQLFALL